MGRKPKTALLRKCDKCGKPQKPSKFNPDSAWSIEYEPHKTCECGGTFKFLQVPYAEYEAFMKSFRPSNKQAPDRCRDCEHFDGEDLCYLDGHYAISDEQIDEEKPYWCPLDKQTVN